MLQWVAGESKGTQATQNASQKSWGTKVRKLGGKCSKTHLQASLIPTFSRGYTPGLRLKREGTEGGGRRKGKQKRNVASRLSGGWRPLMGGVPPTLKLAVSWDFRDGRFPHEAVGDVRQVAAASDHPAPSSPTYRPMTTQHFCAAKMHSLAKNRDEWGSVTR